MFTIAVSNKLLIYNDTTKPLEPLVVVAHFGILITANPQLRILACIITPTTLDHRGLLDAYSV